MWHNAISYEFIWIAKNKNPISGVISGAFSRLSHLPLIFAMNNLNSKSFFLVQDNINTASKFAVEQILKTFDKLCLFHISLENRYSFTLAPAGYTKVNLCRKWDVDDTFDLQYDDLLERKNSVVLIDSLNQMILLFGWQKCFNCVQKMIRNKNISAVVGVFHKNTILNDRRTFDSFKHIATTYIEVLHNASLQKTAIFYVFNRNKQKGLLIPKQVIYCDDFGLKKVSCLKTQKSDNTESALHSTFKISLRDEEKLVKDNLQLPYEIVSKENESKVHYEHDPGDDWDDEDPDDDLLI